MGIGGIGIWQLLIILIIVLVLFGGKKLRGLGGDLGGAIKSFKKAVDGGENKSGDNKSPDDKITAQNDNDSADAGKTGERGA